MAPVFYYRRPARVSYILLILLIGTIVERTKYDLKYWRAAMNFFLQLFELWLSMTVTKSKLKNVAEHSAED